MSFLFLTFWQPLLAISFRCVFVWSEAKDLIMLTAVLAEGSREWDNAWQIHTLLLCAQSVMKNVHGALLFPKQKDLPSELY